MNNNDSSIKSMYLTLFILGIIETIPIPFFMNLVGIAVLVIALILRSKLKALGKPVTNGINLMILASVLHIVIFICGVFMGMSFISSFFYIYTVMISLFVYIAVFIILIIACVMIYKEYDAIK